MRGNQSLELVYSDKMLSRAMFIHLVYENCCGTLTCMGQFSSDVADDVRELIFECRKCKEKIILI